MTRASSVHRGFTLIELLFALVLVGIVGGTIGRLIAGQQRFYASIDERLAMRARLRDGADVLSLAIRHAAVQGVPISLATDSAVDIATVIGTGTVCGTSGSRIDLSPEAPVAGHALTSLAMTPDTTDDVLVYDRGTPGSGPRWSRARIIDVGTRAASVFCAGSPLVSVADFTSRVTELVVAPTIAAPSGAPVRIVRRVRFDVYRAGDGLYYLGYRTCAPGCAGVQPVAGPYGTSASAVSMRYFDATGALLRTPLDPAALGRVTRIDVVLRATSRGVVDLPGRSRAIARDSALVPIALRNAP